MPLRTFLKLVQWMRTKGGLKDTKGGTVETKLYLFLYVVGQEAKNRGAQFPYQRSGATVSRSELPTYMLQKSHRIIK